MTDVSNTTREPAWDADARRWYIGNHSWEPVPDMEDNPHAVACPSFNASSYEPDVGCCGEDRCECAAERRKRGGKL